MKLTGGELISSAGAQTADDSAAKDSLAENLAVDISDEFHERAKKDIKDDTSETLLKPSLEATRMADRNDLDFPISREDEIFSSALDPSKPTAGAFENDPSVKTMFSEKDEIFDFVAASQKQGKEKSSPPRSEKLFEEEGFVQKVRPEVMSPEAELEKLSPTAHKETKSEAHGEAAMSLKEKLDLTGKLEDKLTLTIKELIWEIVPSLAEKIIKEEIDKIKSEANNTGF